jgi:chorismate mutase
VEENPNYRLLNVLSGHDVVPQYERYVKRVAAYRKANKSPLSDPALVESMLKSAREADPALARELEEGGRDADLAVDRMVKKYGQ